MAACTIIANKKYSHDISQDGLGILCIVYFRDSSANSKNSAMKAEELVKIALDGEMQIGTSSSPSEAIITVPD